MSASSLPSFGVPFSTSVHAVSPRLFFARQVRSRCHECVDSLSVRNHHEQRISFAVRRLRIHPMFEIDRDQRGSSRIVLRSKERGSLSSLIFRRQIDSMFEKQVRHLRTLRVEEQRGKRARPHRRLRVCPMLDEPPHNIHTGNHHRQFESRPDIRIKSGPCLHKHFRDLRSARHGKRGKPVRVHLVCFRSIGEQQGDRLLLALARRTHQKRVLSSFS